MIGENIQSSVCEDTKEHTINIDMILSNLEKEQGHGIIVKHYQPEEGAFSEKVKIELVWFDHKCNREVSVITIETKEQFLALFRALMPLSKNIQTSGVH